MRRHRSTTLALGMLNIKPRAARGAPRAKPKPLPHDGYPDSATANVARCLPRDLAAELWAGLLTSETYSNADDKRRERLLACALDEWCEMIIAPRTLKPLHGIVVCAGLNAIDWEAIARRVIAGTL